jgi:hypothetical protein
MRRHKPKCMNMKYEYSDYKGHERLQQQFHINQLISEGRLPSLKNAVFWDAALWGLIINRRFGGTSLLHLTVC